MIRRFLKRWASSSLQREIEKLQAELEAEGRRLKVVEAERDNLALVISRDRSRIESEIAAYQRTRAEHEGIRNDRSTGEGIRKFTA